MKFHHGWAFPDADDFMWREMRPDGSYQRGHLDAALSYVTDFTIAIDGGAHVGTWSRVLSQHFGRVIAVEPSPDTREALEENLKRFGCANVEVVPAALGAALGTVSLAPLDPRAAQAGNTGARFVQPGPDLPCLTIDSLALSSLGFLKLDIEGSEPLALEGAAATLRSFRPIVLFENKGFWRQRFGRAKDAPQQILTSLRYRRLAVAGKDEIWGPA